MEVLDSVIIVGIGLIIQGLGFFFYVKFELSQLRKDLVKLEMKVIEEDKAIEEKRLANVDYLKEIYDAKIDGARNFAKNLFESRDSEFQSIREKMTGMEKTLAQILDILMKRG